MYRNYYSKYKYGTWNLQLQKCLPFFYVEEKFSQLDKRDRKVAEKCISGILFETKMSTDISADGKLNRQQQNPYSGFNFSIPQQGQQGSYSIQGQSYMGMLSRWFLIFSVVSLHSTKTVWDKLVWNKKLVLSLNNISIAILLLLHLQNSPLIFSLPILHKRMRCGTFMELVASKMNQ